MKFKNMVQEIIGDSEAKFGLSEALVLAYLKKHDGVKFEVAEQVAQSECDGIVVTVYCMQDFGSFPFDEDNKIALSTNIVITKKDLLQTMNDILDVKKINQVKDFIFGLQGDLKFNLEECLVYAVESLVKGGDLESLIDTLLKYEYPFPQEIALKEKLIQSISTIIELGWGNEHAEVLIEKIKKNTVARLEARLEATVEATNDVATLYKLETVIKESAIYTGISKCLSTFYQHTPQFFTFSCLSDDDHSAKKLGPDFRGSIDAIFKKRQDALLKKIEKGYGLHEDESDEDESDDETNPSASPST